MIYSLYSLYYLKRLHNNTYYDYHNDNHYDNDYHNGS